MTIAPDGKMIYVTNKASNTLDVFNVNSLGRVTLKTSVSTGRKPSDIAIDPMGKNLYITNFDDHTILRYLIHKYIIGN